MAATADLKYRRPTSAGSRSSSFSATSSSSSASDAGSGAMDLEGLQKMLDVAHTDNAKLHRRIDELESELESSKADVTKMRNRHNVRAQEVEATRQNICELEVQLQAYSTDLENLRRENRVMSKENAELLSRIDKEAKNLERLRAEWSSRESNLLEQLKQQRQENRQLKTQSVMFEKQLASAVNVDASAGSDEVTELKQELKKSEKKIQVLNLELTEAQRVAQELESQLRNQHDATAALRDERDQLKSINMSLMEEAENYQQAMFEQSHVTGGIEEEVRSSDEEGSYEDSQNADWEEETSSRRDSRGSYESPKRVAVAGERPPFGSGRLSPSEAGVSYTARSTSDDSFTAVDASSSTCSADLEMAHLKHKIHGYEDLIEKLLNRILEDDEEAKAALLANKAKTKGENLNRRLAWFFGSRSDTESRKSSETEREGRKSTEIPTSPAKSPSTAPAATLASISGRESTTPTPSASTTSPSIKFGTTDTSRLSSKLEKVISRSTSMTFVREKSLSRSSSTTFTKLIHSIPEDSTPTIPSTTTPTTDSFSITTPISSPPSISQKRLSVQPATNAPGFMSRLWRSTWIGAPAGHQEQLKQLGLDVDSVPAAAEDSLNGRSRASSSVKQNEVLDMAAMDDEWKELEEMTKNLRSPRQLKTAA
ncbi:hypothetical protein HDU97_009070 [Phlyctochytrium planicorne]|nr:hypothetical protein HDU97_009070 [Phlyctochytrium planicorne]